MAQFRVVLDTGYQIQTGSSPLRESMVVCKQDTTIDQLRKYCNCCHERWGITALQIFIHQDEGHYSIPGDNSTWKPNCHAHIVWDWMNHDETGKSCKLGKVDMSLMQDMVASSPRYNVGTAMPILVDFVSQFLRLRIYKSSIHSFYFKYLEMVAQI